MLHNGLYSMEALNFTVKGSSFIFSFINILVYSPDTVDNSNMKWSGLLGVDFALVMPLQLESTHIN